MKVFDRVEILDNDYLFTTGNCPVDLFECTIGDRLNPNLVFSMIDEKENKVGCTGIVIFILDNKDLNVILIDNKICIMTSSSLKVIE